MPQVPEKNHWERVLSVEVDKVFDLLEAGAQNQSDFCRILELFEERVSRLEDRRWRWPWARRRPVMVLTLTVIGPDRKGDE